MNEAAVRGAIAEVIDPCSRLYGSDLSLLDLGMVDAITVDNGRVHVELLLDDPLCAYTAVIQRQLRERIAAVEGVREVEISVIPEFTWSRERATPRAHAVLRPLPLQSVR